MVVEDGPVIPQNSISLEADYVTVVEDRPIMSAEYPFTFGQNGPTQQLHGLFVTAKQLVALKVKGRSQICPHLFDIQNQSPR